MRLNLGSWIIRADNDDVNAPTPNRNHVSMFTFSLQLTDPLIPPPRGRGTAAQMCFFKCNAIVSVTCPGSLLVELTLLLYAFSSSLCPLT